MSGLIELIKPRILRAGSYRRRPQAFMRSRLFIISLLFLFSRVHDIIASVSSEFIYELWIPSIGTGKKVLDQVFFDFCVV